MAITKIEWAHYTFNPWIGCTKVQQADGTLHPACVNCYAEEYANRYKITKWGKGKPRHRTTEGYWKKPLMWNKQVESTGLRTVFCASLADIFDVEVEQSWRDDLWKLIEATPNLTWLILTKRPLNVMLMIPPEWKLNPPNNIMLGTSVSDQATTDEFLFNLLPLGRLFRLFVSIEPLLGAINLRYYLSNFWRGASAPNHYCLKWVIVGGESGRKARPMHPDWVRDIRDDCKAAGTPFHFKQWGEWQDGSNYPADVKHKIILTDGRIYDWTPKTETSDLSRSEWTSLHPTVIARVGKKAAGRLLDGLEWNQYPEVKA